MFALLKIARLLATVLCVVLVFISYRPEDMVGFFMALVPSSFFLALIWLVPLAFGHRRPRVRVKHREGFHPSVEHDNIALDPGLDILWVRDPVRGERYIKRRDVLSARTAHDWRNGTFRQRIELRIADIENPVWQVLFERHSDRWIKSSQFNGQERDEWFSRIAAWTGLATLK